MMLGINKIEIKSLMKIVFLDHVRNYNYKCIYYNAKYV